MIYGHLLLPYYVNHIISYINCKINKIFYIYIVSRFSTVLSLFTAQVFKVVLVSLNITWTSSSATGTCSMPLGIIK